jgi:hypothetical protein
VQLLGGFRHVDLDEGLDLTFNRMAINGSGSNVVFQGTAFPAPSGVSSLDSFQTRNQFYGGQIGAQGEYCLGRLFLAFAGKLALGDCHESLNIAGTSTLIQSPGPNVTVAGGQFAAASNSGRSTRDQFAVVPELELSVGCHLAPNIRAFAGYDLLYLSRVARPGSQVDLIVDNKGDQIDPSFTGETTSFPRRLFRQTDFWAQGVSVGLELAF